MATTMTRGLLFIPDISGFTAFVNRTEIDHSRLIIQELLETLINANAIGLEISEIEGDAILFYRYGDPPALRDLYGQVERMFCAFHQAISAYDMRKYCQCRACLATNDLTLKVITHYGEFTGYNVKSFNKLIGRDIIVAHELLKNDIEQHEYWLVTQNVLRDDAPDRLAPWMEWSAGAKETRSGKVPFRYTQLTRLREGLTPEPAPSPELTNRVKVITLSREYDADIIPLFHATGDFAHRPRWMEGVKRVEDLDNLLPRVGMRCRCVLESGEVVTYSNSYRYSPERIEFSEAAEGTGTVMCFTLESIGEARTRLTLDYYVGRNPAAEAIFRWIRKREMERRLVRSLENLSPLVQEISERLSVASA